MIQDGDPVAAVFFDGETAQRHAVLVSVSHDAGGLIIDLQTGRSPWLWPLDRLRRLPDHAQAHSLTLTLLANSKDEAPRDPARLVLTEQSLINWLLKSAPSLHKSDIRRGTAGKVVKRVALAVVAIGALLFVVLPRMSDVLAKHIPLQTEVAFGQTVITQMERVLGGRDGDLLCRNPEGEAALNRLASRLLDGQDLGYPIRFSVFNHKMVNAFAAPGGQIVIMRGLLDASDTPEEVAAVLAHEIGHVEARDPTRLMLRAAGSAGIISVILGDVTGGTVIGIIGDQVLQSAYTRNAEAAADEFALHMLQVARIDAAAFADFFDKLAGLERGFVPPEYLSSHPSSATRATRARDFAAVQGPVTPVLSTADWKALKAMCKPL